MGEYEIELVSKQGQSVIGEANDLESALNCLHDAIREYPRGHIRVRRGARFCLNEYLLSYGRPSDAEGTFGA
jgi:hypothetical protein